MRLQLNRLELSSFETRDTAAGTAAIGLSDRVYQFRP